MNKSVNKKMDSKLPTQNSNPMDNFGMESDCPQQATADSDDLKRHQKPAPTESIRKKAVILKGSRDEDPRKKESETLHEHLDEEGGKDLLRQRFGHGWADIDDSNAEFIQRVCPTQTITQDTLDKLMKAASEQFFQVSRKEE